MEKYTLYDAVKFANAFSLDFFSHFDIADDNINPYMYRDIGSADGYIMQEYLYYDIIDEMYDKNIIITSNDVIVSYLQEKMRNDCHYILEVSWFFNLDEQLKNYIIVKANAYRDGRMMLTVKHIDDVEA